MPKRLATDSTPSSFSRSEARSFSIDSTGRVYTRVFRSVNGATQGQWRRMRGVNAQQIVTASQAHLQRHIKIVRFQRYVIWGCLLLAAVLAWRGCR